MNDISRLRERRGQTGEALGAQVGLSKSTISAVEIGTRALSAASIRRVLSRFPKDCAALGITAETLLATNRKGIRSDSLNGTGRRGHRKGRAAAAPATAAIRKAGG